MSEHDDSLEIGIAAGLDLPTALVISESDGDDSLTPPTGKPTGCVGMLIVILMTLAACTVFALTT